MSPGQTGPVAVRGPAAPYQLPGRIIGARRSDTISGVSFHTGRWRLPRLPSRSTSPPDQEYVSGRASGAFIIRCPVPQEAPGRYIQPFLALGVLSGVMVPVAVLPVVPERNIIIGGAGSRSIGEKPGLAGAGLDVGFAIGLVPNLPGPSRVRHVALGAM